MKIKSERDFWSGLMFLVAGIVFAVGASNYRLGSSAHPGPGYFPLILGGFMAVLGGLVLFKALTIETEGGDPIGDIAWRPLLVIVATIAVFGALLPRMGLIVSVPVLVVMASLAGGEFKWKGVVAASVVLTLFAWLVFVAGLKLVIPLWPAFLAP